MRLYKNVDLCDLEQILNQGVLSLDSCRNDNWENGHRANNRTDKVYLFSPVSFENSFCNYGIVLIEVDVDDACVSEISEHDAYYGRYEEYICDYVAPDRIVAAYIPTIFKDKINLVNDKIKYVKISAEWYNEDAVPMKQECCSDDVLERFSETAEYECSNEINFFRGVTVKNHMIDLYNIHYYI